MWVKTGSVGHSWSLAPAVCCTTGWRSSTPGPTSLSGQWPALSVRSVARLHCQVSGQPSLSGQWPTLSVRSVPSLHYEVCGQPSLSGQWSTFTVRSVASLQCQISGQTSLSNQWSMASLHCQISGQSSMTCQWPAFSVWSGASLPVLGQWPAFTVRSVASIHCQVNGQPSSARSVASLHCQVSGQPSLSDQRPAFAVGSVASKQQGWVCCGSTDSALILLDLSGFLQAFKVGGKWSGIFKALKVWVKNKWFKFGHWKCEFLLLWTNWNADNTPALRTTVHVASCFWLLQIIILKWIKSK